MALHVGLNLAFLIQGETGGRETYARELSLALADAHPDFRITSFVSRDAGDDGFWKELGSVVQLPSSPRSRPQWAWAEIVGVPVAAARARVDLLHSLANFGPTAGPFARVLTLHDLLHRSHPQLLTPASRLATGALLSPAARRAHRLMTVSHASRDEIVTELGIPAGRIDVVPNGVSPPICGDGARAKHRLEAGNRPIALSVAADLPHKNLGMLLEGSSLLKPEERPLLVLVGAGTDEGRLPEKVSALALESDVRLLGTVSEPELEDLYAAAGQLVTATRHEGFGIPLLEAMARDVPVACSDLPVLREVAGDAAHWLDPDQPSSVADALRRLATDETTADRLRGAGRERVRSFSWSNAARATAASYDRAMDSARRGL